MRRTTFIHGSAIAALVQAACGSQQPRPPGATPGAAQPAHSQVAAWSRFDESRAWPVLASFDSSGHPAGDRWTSVRVSPNAEQAYLALVRGSELAVGAVVVADLAPMAGSPLTALLVMEKSDSGWTYSSLGAGGSVVLETAQPQLAPLCKRCHSEGLSDELFGIPRNH